MDQSRSYWNQKEQSTCLNSHVLSMLGCSWEEQAFAEDAAGPMGGCIWPPRSYTCSFCRREFRSAQALGGHMNVHRRDRARLKKISSSTSNPNPNPNPNPNSNSSSYHKMNQVIELDPPTTTSSDICLLQNPSKICNPSFDLDHNLSLNSSSSCSMSNSVSILRPFTCSFDLELPQKRFRIDHLGNEDKGITIGTKVLELTSTTLNKSNEQSKVHLASDFNSLVRKRSFDSETPIFNTKDDVHKGLIFKKRRIEGGAGYSFFSRKNNLQLDADRDGDEDEDDAVIPVERSKNSRLESLDLELRLGDPRS